MNKNGEIIVCFKLWQST